MNKYYVYAYLDPRKPGKYIYNEYTFDYEPFYIGKGTGPRYLRHLNSYTANAIKFNKIQKIIKKNLNPIIIKLIENISNKKACEIEIELISKIGRLINNTGILTNVTIGGEGKEGYKHTIEYINKLNKPVIKYDLDGNVLEEYKSVQDASIYNNVTPQAISHVCSGNIKIFKDEFIFLYKDQKFESRKRYKKEYMVARIDFNNITTTYISLTQASIENHITISNINAVCIGKRFQSHGYLWRYISHHKLKEFTNKINEKWNIELSILNKKIINIEDNIIYTNILHAISENRNLRINMLYYKNNKFKILDE